MKKIAFMISSNGWGGLEMNVLKLASLLQQRGFDITLYAVENTRLYTEAAQYSIRSVPIVKHRKYFEWWKAYQFSKQLKESEADTCVLFDNRDLDFIFIIKKLFQTTLKVIYQQHMQIGVNKNDFIHTFRYSAIDTWVSPLNYLKEEVSQKINYPNDNIIVIPIGVSLEKCIPAQYTQQEARAKLRISSAKKLIGIIGRIDFNKGQLFVVKAVQKLRQQGHDVELLIMGSATVNNRKAAAYLAELNKYIFQHKLTSCVFIRPHNSDIQLFYNAIDVFTMASESETYGMVTIEALLSNKPILATDAGGTSELLKGGKIGSLYKHNDEDEFCHKIIPLLQLNDETISVLAEGKKVALDEYTDVKEAQLWTELLNKTVITDQ